MRSRFIALLVLPFALLLAAAVPASPPAPSAVPSVSLAAAPGDTFAIVAQWPSVAVADSYVVSYTVHKYPVSTAFPTPLAARTLTGTADTLRTPAPAYPDSLRVTVAVYSKRGAVASASAATAFRFFRRSNPVPPPPPSVSLDTLGTS